MVFLYNTHVVSSNVNILHYNNTFVKLMSIGTLLLIGLQIRY